MLYSSNSFCGHMWVINVIRDAPTLKRMVNAKVKRWSEKMSFIV
jgi:hypothetical protein